MLARLAFAVFLCSGVGYAVAQQSAPKVEEPADAPKADAAKPDTEGEEAKTDGEANGGEKAETAENRPKNPSQPNTANGEGRRNENVQVNLVDTNATREMNQRVGATATIVEEFRPDRGYFAAEYGNPLRNPIHAQPQRGAGVHGSVFLTHNNSIVTARSFFQVGSVKPARENQYGSSLNTNLWKNSFFTFNGSQAKIRGMVNGNVLIPLLSEHSALTTDPAARAIVNRILDAYPLVAPNRTDIAERALNTNSPQIINVNTANGQLNQKLNERDMIAFRYGFTGQQVDSFQLVKGQNPNTDNKNHNARITWNRVWDARTVMDLSIGFDRTGNLLLPTADAVGPVFLNGLQLLGPSSSIPINRALNNFRYASAVQRKQGRHAFTAGFGLTRQQYNGYETEGSRPTMQFRDDFGTDAITNLRLGRPSTYSLAKGNVHRGFRNWEIQAYAGDHWVASNRLTLNYGITWEPWTLPNDALGLSHLNFNSDWNNVGGHAGFAYRLPKGVLRGAFGIVDGQLFPIAYGQDRFNLPNNVFLSVAAPDIVNPLKAFSAADLAGKGRSVGFDIDPKLATPYSYQYNMSWENEVFRGWKLQLGYVGSRTHKLFQTYQRNRAVFVPGLAFNTKTTNDRRPDPHSFQRFFTTNGSLAYYDAGRATLLTPRWHGTTMSASYWFSKSIDTGSDYAVTGGGQERWRQPGQTESGVLSDQKGLSNFDQPHSVILQGNWDTGRAGGGWLKKMYQGWNFAPVLLLKSGTPFMVDSGSDSPGFGNGDGTNSDRPNIVDPSILGRIIGNPDTSQSLMPRSAFRFMNAPLEMRGNIGRNTFRKGKIANLNAGLSRNFALRSDWTMTLRAEAINLSNTPQFAEPGLSLSSANFGQITNTLNDGRTFKFTLRLAF